MHNPDGELAKAAEEALKGVNRECSRCKTGRPLKSYREKRPGVPYAVCTTCQDKQKGCVPKEARVKVEPPKVEEAVKNGEDTAAIQVVGKGKKGNVKIVKRKTEPPLKQLPKNLDKVKTN